MYDDNNFFIFIICIFVIIGVSQTLLRSIDCLKMDGLCNLFIVLLYPILIYLVIESIKATKNSLHKTSRYLLNGLTLIVLVLILLFNLIHFIHFVYFIYLFKFRKKKTF